MRRTRGISPAITAALLIVVGIAIVASLWFFSQKFTTGGDFLQVQAFKIQNKYVGGNQVVVTGIRLISKSDKQLTVSKIRAVLTYSDGTTETLTWDSSQGWSTSNKGVTPSGPDGVTTINPGSTAELTITFSIPTTSGQIVSVAYQIEVQDPAGNTYTFSSNEVPVT